MSFGWPVQKEGEGQWGWVKTASNAPDTLFRLGRSRGKRKFLDLAESRALTDGRRRHCAWFYGRFHWLFMDVQTVVDSPYDRDVREAGIKHPYDEQQGGTFYPPSRRQTQALLREQDTERGRCDERSSLGLPHHLVAQAPELLCRVRGHRAEVADCLIYRVSERLLLSFSSSQTALSFRRH